MRSQPGIFESGKPPSEPFSFLKRATRLSISLRDTPRRGRVSSYSMTTSFRKPGTDHGFLDLPVSPPFAFGPSIPNTVSRKTVVCPRFSTAPLACFIILPRRRDESTALCLRATDERRRGACASCRAQGRGAGARGRTEPRPDAEFPRRSAESSRRHQPHRGTRGDQ